MALGIRYNRDLLIGMHIRIYTCLTGEVDRMYYVGTVQAADDDGIRIEPEHKFVPWIIFPWAHIHLIMPEEPK